VRRIYEYGVGRSTTASDHAWLDYADQHFAHDGYGLRGLIRTIAGSEAFQAVSAVPAEKVAAN
jgi:hypothetical protein